MSWIAVHDGMAVDDLVYARVGVRERVCVGGDGWFGLCAATGLVEEGQEAAS